MTLNKCVKNSFLSKILNKKIILDWTKDKKEIKEIIIIYSYSGLVNNMSGLGPDIFSLRFRKDKLGNEKQKMSTKNKDIIDKKSINYSFNSFYIKYQISHHIIVLMVI